PATARASLSRTSSTRRLVATGRTVHVLPFLFNVTALVLVLGVRAGAITLPFLPLHGARLVGAGLPRVIWVDAHCRSPYCFEERTSACNRKLWGPNTRPYPPEG